ncbi:hypothetical protein PISS_a2317 [Pseudoalteromonas issachenkonii]|uniref:Uncharacterized protein n=1 Tax=Pseudoalteromonas issachenkonii TaxID=152297 RepID=A0ABN5C278_9GAMM|nr:hypothetical protein PISS_a2317 [Pseudoalteromonas issachenkonii]
MSKMVKHAIAFVSHVMPFNCMQWRKNKSTLICLYYKRRV